MCQEDIFSLGATAYNTEGPRLGNVCMAQVRQETATPVSRKGQLLRSCSPGKHQTVMSPELRGSSESEQQVLSCAMQVYQSSSYVGMASRMCNAVVYFGFLGIFGPKVQGDFPQGDFPKKGLARQTAHSKHA